MRTKYEQNDGSGGLGSPPLPGQLPCHSRFVADPSVTGHGGWCLDFARESLGKRCPTGPMRDYQGRFGQSLFFETALQVELIASTQFGCHSCSGRAKTTLENAMCSCC